jgi:hypothetical protein
MEALPSRIRPSSTHLYRPPKPPLLLIPPETKRPAAKMDPRTRGIRLQTRTSSRYTDDPIGYSI